MKLAFIGIGNVGFALANNLQREGYEIIVANNNPESESVQKALQQNPNFEVLPLQKAVDAAEIVFLATPFMANESILKSIDLKDKILIDCTNPVGKGISHGLESKISGAEKVQEWSGNAQVIKAFTIYGFENFQDATFANYDVKPVMLVAGNHSSAKDIFEPLVEALGFQMKDVGALDQALHLEHMTLLWVKMVRRDGHHPNFVWAYLEK
jgi:predicted dinucleotide-binding enzyme